MTRFLLRLKQLWLALLTNWKPILIVLVVIAVAISLSTLVWLFLPSGRLVGTPALDNFEAAMDVAMQSTLRQFDLWYKGNIIIQAILIITALLATVTASLTNSVNADRIKKYTILLTAVTAALTSVQSTFHIRDNINSFIDVAGKLVVLEHDYLVKRSEFNQELLQEDQKWKQLTKEEQGKSYKITPPDVLKLQNSFMQQYINIESEQMRAWASIGQPSAPTLGEHPPPAGKTPPDQSDRENK